MIGIVYLVRSKTTGKVYIGRTTQALALRWAGHVHDSKGNVVTGIHGAIKREGPDNFTIEELERHPDKASLMVAERDAIERYNARDPNVGYNLMIGYKARGEVEDTKLLTKSVHIRMTEAEYKAIGVVASSDGRTISNWARANLVGLTRRVLEPESGTTVKVATGADLDAPGPEQSPLLESVPDIVLEPVTTPESMDDTAWLESLEFDLGD